MTRGATREMLTPVERAVLDAFEIEIRELYAPVRAALAAVEPAVEAAGERCSRALEAARPTEHRPQLGAARMAAAQLVAS